MTNSRTNRDVVRREIGPTRNREDVMPDGSDDPRQLSRRNLFKHVGIAGAAAALSGAPVVESAAAQTPAAPPHREALETLTAAEGDTLEAIVARLIPTDENGPGAAEARAAHYIDRALDRSAARVARSLRGGPRRTRRLRAHVQEGRAFAKLPRRPGRSAERHGEEHRHRLHAQRAGVLQSGPRRTRSRARSAIPTTAATPISSAGI